MKKSFLFIIQRSPHHSLHVQELLDQLLIAAAFEQTVRVLLLDDGVFLFKKEQQPALISAKAVAPIIDSLALFDVNEIYIEQESLVERGLTAAELLHPVIELPREEIGGLIGRHQIVVSV